MSIVFNIQIVYYIIFCYLAKVICLCNTPICCMQDNNDDEQENESQTPHTDVMPMGESTEVSASLAGLSLDVRTEDREECEEMFNRLWDKLMDDAEKMSDSLDERMGGLQ